MNVSIVVQKKAPLQWTMLSQKIKAVLIRGKILLPHANRAIVKKETGLQSRQKCHLRKCLGSQIKYIIFSNLSLITKYPGSHIFSWSRFEACFEWHSTIGRSPSRKLFWNDVPNDKLPREERSFLFYSQLSCSYYPSRQRSSEKKYISGSCGFFC